MYPRRQIITAFIAITLLPLTALCQDESDGNGLRFWISRSGDQYLQARLVGVTQTSVLLRDAGGKDHEVELRELSNEDRDHAQRFGKQMARGLGKLQSKNEQPRDTQPDDEAADDESYSPVEEIPAPTSEPLSNAQRDAAAAPKAKAVPELPGVLKTLSNLVSPATSQDDSQPAKKDSEAKQKTNGSRPIFGPDSSVYVALSGKFLNEFVRLPIEEEKQVADVILGTPVAGNARTYGSVTMVLIPSPDQASFELVARGKADSITTGYQPMINVHSDGTTQFEARKRISVSSQGIRLFPATAKANTKVHRSSVTTELPGVLGDIAGQIVGQIVSENRPQIDYEASHRAAARAARDLDIRVDNEAVRLQRILKQLAPGMAAGEPVVPVLFRTSADRLEILIGENQPAQWTQFEKGAPSEDEDIVVVLPKKAVDTARRVKTAMKLLALGVGDQLSDINTDELTPTKQAWSEDRQWLTLAWNVENPVVRAISADLLPPVVQPAAPEPPQPREQPLVRRRPLLRSRQNGQPPATDSPADVPQRFPRAPIFRRFRP